jgi:hypothetical protein
VAWRGGDSAPLGCIDPGLVRGWMPPPVGAFRSFPAGGNRFLCQVMVEVCGSSHLPTPSCAGRSGESCEEKATRPVAVAAAGFRGGPGMVHET